MTTIYVSFAHDVEQQIEAAAFYEWLQTPGMEMPPVLKAVLEKCGVKDEKDTSDVYTPSDFTQKPVETSADVSDAG